MRKGRFLPWSGDDKNCSRFEYRKNGIFVATSPGPCQIAMTSLDFRLRAVPLRSVKSKLGRTGESELQSSLSSAGLEKSASNNEQTPPRREALPGGGGLFARLNFKTPRVRVYKCVSIIVGFAVTVAISFYALSLLFGSCRLSDFTLAGPQDSLFYSFPWKSWNWLMHYCPTVRTVNLIISWKRPCFLNKLKLISLRSSSIKQ